MHKKIGLWNKKGLGSLFAIAAALMLAACGGKNATPTSGNTAGTTNASTVQEDSSSSANTSEDAADAGSDNAQDASGKEDTTPADDGKYVFVYHDTAIEVDSDMSVVLDALGEAKGYFEAASCAFEGLDKTYTYNDFEIITYPSGDKDLISVIVLRSDIVSTPEGISIGSAASKVIDTYGECEEQNGMLTYEKGGMRLCFIISNEQVASIEYQTTALD